MTDRVEKLITEYRRYFVENFKVPDNLAYRLHIIPKNICNIVRKDDWTVREDEWFSEWI
jgi:predicted nucleic acid-binding OB-fold protein